ncbi:MAG TPA: MG2 domain-containing protein, partial [Acidobacteriota bacterium]|nr:MG2 domain-containing protein [Acidobacteriota bacterium]
MKSKIKFLGLLIVIVIGFTKLLAQQTDPQQITKEAERYDQEGSYARAYELYQKLDRSKLSAAEARWLDFKLADLLWRSESSTESPDTTNIDKARQQLEVLVRDVTRDEDRDQLWAEVHESLGDSFWTPPTTRNWGQALPYYEKALDWWAGSDQIELARNRYLNIVWKMATPPRIEPYYYYGYYGNTISLPVLENTLKIATTDTERAHAHYLLAMTLRYQGGDISARVQREFEEALKPGKSTEWHDDALFNYAQWLSQSGRIVRNEDGTWRREPDFKKALELYRKLTTQYSKGETRYYDQARNEIENITKPALSVSVSNLFLPGSEIEYYLSWRNISKVDLAIYLVDLTRDLSLGSGSDNWIQQIQMHQPSKTWTKDIQNSENHIPGQESLRIKDPIKPGAYVLVAKSGSLQARDILLVTDASLVVKAAGRKALVYFCDVKSGAPVDGARIKLWQKYYANSQYLWRTQEAVTDQNGLAKIELIGNEYNNELLVTAIKQDRTAFSGGYNSYYNPFKGWKIYAFTDRPAYRPGEEVQWKIIARILETNGYRNPAETTLQMEVHDPRGTKIQDQTIRLNAFGSAWGNISVNESMPLGEYQVIFYDAEKRNSIGSASLFRLEEYKLPEFQVTIQTPEENGKKKSFRLGETVDINIQADYYFGGPVANANVEVVVYQNPFYHWWTPYRDYPWYYEDFQQQRMWYGQGQIMKRETLKTDVTGKAVLKIETPYGQQQDQEYRIEARVTDSSRREIIASDSVRVTRQRYFVHQTPEHNLYRPQDVVKIKIKTIDANDQPISAEGTVKITRDYWYEIWIDPDGNEISGKELDEMRKRLAIFPPPPPTPEKPWRLKFRGYQHDDILTHNIKTNSQGDGEISFKAEREGYYRIAWNSEDSAPDLLPVQIASETTVWVATNLTTELGYRHGGLEIIVDQDTVRTGNKAPLMIHTPASGSYVLFSVEGSDLFSYQLIHMTGTVKLIELPIEEMHVPNIFLSAVMVNDQQIFMDTKQVVVPPVKNFLQVQVKSDRDQYQPREEGVLTVTTKDADGNPVAAEIALSLSDESVSYIQQDYAGDPRQFFFGEKRNQMVQTFSTFQQKSFVDLRKKDRGVGEKDYEEFKTGGYAAGGEMNQRAELAADQALPASAPAPVSEIAVRRNANVLAKTAIKEGLATPEEPAVEVRTDFRSTAFWKPDITTDKDGSATVRVKYPDSLTAWKATARVVS